MTKLKKLFKSTYILAGTALLVLFSAGAAFAQIEITGGNGTTGPSSDNDNDWSINHDFDFDFDSFTDLSNDADVDANSGSNTFGHNTKIGDIILGDIMGRLNIENDPAMARWFSMDWNDPEDISVDLTNMLTGPNSDNDNDVRISRDFDFDYSSRSRISNDLDLDLNSGRNRISHNTVVGDVRGGDVSYDASIRNGSSGSIGDFNIPNMESSISADLTNHTTGPNSDNDNSLSIRSDADIDISSCLNIDNDIDVDANSGQNYVGNNTVVGDISTGDVELTLDIENL